MNKAELIDALAQKTGLTNKAAKDVIDALFSIESGILAGELKKRERIQITGFGTFAAEHRPARDWRIPGTDRTKHVEAHYYPKFKAGKSLKDYVK
ncbi:MAG: HU family DNA-binding protein [Candidatus Eisenbacteria bacterium]|nr:HU family DNA-binding protein [Candidatus Eisenbacteria bacterium]